MNPDEDEEDEEADYEVDNSGWTSSRTPST